MLIQWQNIEYSGQNFNEEAQHVFPCIKQISFNRSFSLSIQKKVTRKKKSQLKISTQLSEYYNETEMSRVKWEKVHDLYACRNVYFT